MGWLIFGFTILLLDSPRMLHCNSWMDPILHQCLKGMHLIWANVSPSARDPSSMKVIHQLTRSLAPGKKPTAEPPIFDFEPSWNFLWRPFHTGNRFPSRSATGPAHTCTPSRPAASVTAAMPPVAIDGVGELPVTRGTTGPWDLNGNCWTLATSAPKMVFNGGFCHEKMVAWMLFDMSILQPNIRSAPYVGHQY